MYLKKLELLGFKSFPEKSSFLFTEGITCIVGPNGCGKTNLLDALRWVLGEQRTSLLRGSKMEEVIFSGTRTLKPLGMAEVSLQMENRNGILPSQYGELSIARRLFRSGDSEYLMNKVPCRLRDITDLFADTGLGSHAYAIIQQEMVDAILSDKAEERRFLFEEAAGITKYKQRKLAAERKLQATEQDLLRLQDILAEVTTRVNSLRRQVSKARRYQKISDELKAWDLYNASIAYSEFQGKKADLLANIKVTDDERISLEAKLDTDYAELEEMRRSHTGMEKEINDVSSKIYQLSEEGHRLETDISVCREKKENLGKSAIANRQEIGALNQRAEVIRLDRSECEKELEQTGRVLTKHQDRLDQALAAQRAADEAYLDFRSVADDENTRLLDLENRISSGRNDSANVEEQVDDLHQEMDRQNRRRSALIEEKGQRRQKIDSLRTRVDSMRSTIDQDQRDIRELEKRLEASLTETDRLRDKLSDTDSGYEATLARKNLLAEMIEHYEGFGGGVVAVFDVAGRWVDITGTVADFVLPQSEFRTAIEAALGDSAQFILCQSQATAQEAIDYLRKEKAGRATFLILDKLPAEVSRPDLPRRPGITGWADALVNCDEKYRQVSSALLGRTVICDNSDTARNLVEELPVGFKAVTVGGEKYSNEGLVSGGASEEISLIGRKEEISALNNKLEELDCRMNDIKKNQAEASLKIGELRQSLSRLRDKLDNDKENLSEISAGIKEEQFKISAADEVITSIDQLIEQYSEKLEKLKHRQYSLSLDFDQLDREKNTVAGQVQSKKQHLDELETKAQKAAEEVNRRQVERVELESQKSQCESKLNHLDALLADIADNIGTKQEQIAEAEKLSGQLTEQIKVYETRLKEIFDERDRETSRRQQLRQDYHGSNEKISTIEKQIKERRRQKEEIGEKAHAVQISLTELNSRLEQLDERIRSEYELDINELEIESPNPDYSPDQVRQHISELREKMKRMGVVNLLALEEFDEQKQRQEFLTSQLDDLIQAKGTLKTTISKINQTARTLFLETLEKARENFKQMYEELFTGGEADVYLEDPSNPLESRLEIISRPRGKRPLTITQLSGGERALTAIALLFALYMVKPSPFCFLDEIDAPLDDVNVSRFLTIVKKFSQRTQFIIITHNKITMEAADTLYGVTMEEPGVSKVVSVRFKKGDDIDETLLDMHYAHDDNWMQTG